MYRGLIIGGLAFGAALAAERIISGLGEDLKRYDKLRAMSGQGSFLAELLGMAGTLLGDNSSGEKGGVFDGIVKDVVRYAKLKGM